MDVSQIDDTFFAREAADKTKPSEDKFFSTEKKPTTTSPARKTAQTTVDAALKANVDKVDMLGAYLQAKFTLSKNDKPHAMKF